MTTRPAPDSLLERVRQLYTKVRDHKKQIAWHRDQLRIAAADLDAAEQELAKHGLALVKTHSGAGVIHGRDQHPDGSPHPHR